MTEDEARTKECRAPGVHGERVGSTWYDVRWIFPRCIASDCMMWAWSWSPEQSNYYAEQHGDDASNTPSGDCGLKR